MDFKNTKVFNHKDMRAWFLSDLEGGQVIKPLIVVRMTIY